MAASLLSGRGLTHRRAPEPVCPSERLVVGFGSRRVAKASRQQPEPQPQFPEEFRQRQDDRVGLVLFTILCVVLLTEIVTTTLRSKVI